MRLPPVFWMLFIACFTAPAVFSAAGYPAHPMSLLSVLIIACYVIGATTLQKLVYDRLFCRRKAPDHQ